MGDYSAVKAHLESKNLHYFTVYPKFQKPIKAVIRYLPSNIPAEDISDSLVSLGCDVISVKQLTSTRRLSAEGTSQVNLPLFLITLLRTTKSQEIYKVYGLCHISIKVEAYEAQTGLTQCYNCQKFGHVWANCKQPPRCLWVLSVSQLAVAACWVEASFPFSGQSLWRLPPPRRLLVLIFVRG
jgi:hypothetical protein